MKIIFLLLCSFSLHAGLSESLEECGLLVDIYIFTDDIQSYEEYFDDLYERVERSKREDSSSDEMRYSEHCGNTMREVQ